METRRFTFEEANNNTMNVSSFVETAYEKFGKREVFLFCPNGVKYIFATPVKAIMFTFKDISENNQRIIFSEIRDIRSKDITCLIRSTNGDYLFKLLDSFRYNPEDMKRDNEILETPDGQPFLDDGRFKLSLAKKEFENNFTPVELQEACYQQAQRYNNSESSIDDVLFKTLDNKIEHFLNRYFGDRWIKYELLSNNIDRITLAYILKVTFTTGESIELDRPL